ncbi:hypothetical protein PPERSA_10084 [Pseudocohnilembus persalinus]|uniref:Uncharacterized protein n=1 Tax=Pseudocohnilembus persalinus TaxID=266149 RepID=A0A0V0QJF5_PSEPJ|nr:hypothetical protein PPERSA_10084 [Pseudocohnilembus persalinus]|eukprot:KRX02467.1 hypothetical protein PPERSA_10084 [Pseudocohnilembus persalinus]
MAEVQISRNSRFDYGSHRNSGSRKQTFVFQVQNLQGLQVNSQGKKQNVANNNQSVVQNKYYLRLDSPRTNDAMLTLGLNYDNFQQKTQEDFAEQNLDPEIQQMRYEHYLTTLANDVSAVLSKRKQLIESEMRRKGIKNQDEIMEVQINFFNNSIKYINFNIQKQFILIRTKKCLEKIRKLEFNSIYYMAIKGGDQNKLYYFKTNQRISDILLQLNHKNIYAGADYLDLDSLDEEDKLQEQIQQELQKYNIKKRQKQLLAKQDYDLEIQRYQELLRIKEKEDKNEENRIRKEIEEFKLKEQKRQEAQDKGCFE